MRLSALLAIAVLVCSQLHAQSATAPTLPVQKVGTSKSAPSPTLVTVTNFPDVQGVEVVNLPDVQPVSGTVNVGNLPLADDGSLRVASAPPRHAVMHELATEPFDCLGNVVLPVPGTVDGYSNVGVYVNGYGGIGISMVARWSPDEGWLGVADARNGFSVSGSGAFTCYTSSASSRLVCPATTGEVAVVLFCEDHFPVQSVRVYFIP